MNKSDLIDTLRKETNLTKVQAEPTKEQPHQYVLSFHLFSLRFLKRETAR